jgi:hypothetical protein
MVRSQLVFALAAVAGLVAGINLDNDAPIQSTSEIAIRGLKVKRSCIQGSWKVTRERYTTVSNRTQGLAFGISGPSRVLVTKPRKESWTNTMGLSFDEAKSLNPGIELVETFEDVTEEEVIAKEEEHGLVAFTATLYCESGKIQTRDTWSYADSSVGTATCNGAEVSGNICTPKVITNDKRGLRIEGVFRVVQVT